MIIKLIIKLQTLLKYKGPATTGASYETLCETTESLHTSFPTQGFSYKPAGVIAS